MKPIGFPKGRLRVLAFAAGTLALGGCATFSEDQGFSAVAQATRAHTDKDVTWVRTDTQVAARDARVAEILARPLSADDAVEIALLNNQGLQASFFDLSIAEADRVQAGRLPNPSISFSRLTRGDELEIERGLHFNLARLLTIPLALEMEGRRFEQVQRETTIEVLRVASETRKAYFRALAAEETVRYMRQVQLAAEASSELARRMAQAGNWSRLAQAREQGFYAESALSTARAEQARTAARERLTRLLGLWGEQTRFQLPERLPDLPKEVQDRPGIEMTAMQQRMDVQAARLGSEALARNLGLSRVTGFVNVLEVGAVRNSEAPLPTQRGYEISLELPIFNWGDARVAKAEALYRQALAHTAQVAVNARSEVREAYLGYRASYDIARHYRDEIVPLHKRIAEENLLRYNGMLIGVFDLLADARAQIASVNGYVESLRDFWLAESDMRMALVGRPTLGSPPRPAMATPETGADH